MQNCVLYEMPTRFTAAPDLILDAYRRYPEFGTENWSYPFLSWGEPKGLFYSEIWTSGMDWNIDYWIIYVKDNINPRAELFLSFPNNEKKINSYDLKQIFNVLISRFENPNNCLCGNDILCFLHVEKKYNDIFTEYTYSHASQKEVRLYINNKFLGG